MYTNLFSSSLSNMMLRQQNHTNSAAVSRQGGHKHCPRSPPEVRHKVAHCSLLNTTDVPILVDEHHDRHLPRRRLEDGHDVVEQPVVLVGAALNNVSLGATTTTNIFLSIMVVNRHSDHRSSDRSTIDTAARAAAAVTFDSTTQRSRPPPPCTAHHRCKASTTTNHHDIHMNSIYNQRHRNKAQSRRQAGEE